MPILTAAQHFYTSVPVEGSPSRRRGYQTLFYTPGLGDAAVRAIEDRSQYMTAPGDPLKHQFYPLPGGFFAISQSVALAELDEYGRKGRYLTHTLVIDPASFDSLGGCPLDIFQQFAFNTRLDQVYSQGQMKTGAAPAVEFRLDPTWQVSAVQSARAWPANQYEQLGRLAWQVSSLLEKRQNLALLGAGSLQLAFLSLMFLLSSPNRRSKLSFDTHAAGCQWGSGVSFWALGYLGQPEGHPVVQVDLETRRLTGTLSPADDDSYAVWMVNQGLHGGLESLGQRQTWAAMLSQALALDQTYSAPVNFEQIPENFRSRYAQLNREHIVKRWVGVLPAGLSTETISRMAMHVRNDPLAYFNFLLQGVQDINIQEFMLMELLSLGNLPPKADRAALDKWIRNSNHLSLLSLPPFWEGNAKEWTKSLQQIESGPYRYFLIQLSHWNDPPIPLWQALVEPHGVDWIHSIGPRITPGEWKKVLPLLAKMGDDTVEELAPIVPRLQPAARAEITSWLKGQKSDLPKLRYALGLPLQKEEKKGAKRFKLF